MKKNLLISMTCAMALVMVVPVPVAAQQEVADLEDLVGARGSSGESQLIDRGYENVGGEKSEESSYTYWREPKTNKCVSVRVSDGRIASIVHTPRADCERFESEFGKSSHPGSADEGSFDTVCGVVVDGKTHRYRCQVRNEGCEGEGHCRTVLTFPDNEMTLNWHKDNQVEVVIEGLVPVNTTSSFENGQTKFEMDGKTYFLYRSRDRAKKEVAKLRQ